MTTTYAIRLATPADLAAVDALLASSYPRLLARDYPPSVLVTALPVISRARPELLASGSYFLAEAPDGAIVGAGGWTAGAPSDGRVRNRTGQIRHVVTDHRHTRRGIAAAIMAQVFDQATRAGVRRMGCLATRTAVPFYASLGFRAVGPIEVTLRPGISFPAVQMVRTM